MQEKRYFRYHFIIKTHLLITILIISALCCMGQNAKKLFEEGDLLAQSGKLDESLELYFQGALKNAKAWETGTTKYFLVVSKAVDAKYRHADLQNDLTQRIEAFTKATQFVKAERGRWSDDEKKRNVKPDWKFIF